MRTTNLSESHHRNLKDRLYAAHRSARTVIIDILFNKSFGVCAKKLG